MIFEIRKMNQSEAMEIADDWKYENEYSVYDMTEDAEDYEEITSETKRADNYFSVLNNNRLYGFFCISKKENEIELGLGMKPEHTGKGKGIEFVYHILDYVIANYRAQAISLLVASFNIRAYKVYEKAGFTAKGTTTVSINGENHEFVKMEYVKR